MDVMKLAQGGAGFAGGLAAVVESVGGCTYRVVAGGDECGSGDEGVARGRKRGDKVNIHVSFRVLWRPGIRSGDRSSFLLSVCSYVLGDLSDGGHICQNFSSNLLHFVWAAQRCPRLCFLARSVHDVPYT